MGIFSSLGASLKSSAAQFAQQAVQQVQQQAMQQFDAAMGAVMGAALGAAGMGGGMGGGGGGGGKSHIVGGVSLQQARTMHAKMAGMRYARKNLFFLEMSSKLTGTMGQEKLNIFAIGVDYAPFTLAGDKHKIGAAMIDTVNGREAVELRITTYDDAGGTLRRWFEAHMNKIAPQDGTVGLPAEWAVSIRVLHAFVDDASNEGGFETRGLWRPVSLETSLSRSEDGMQELQMSFTELDPCMGVM